MGDFVMLKRKVTNTLGVPVRPHSLRVVALRGSGVAVLQGSDGETITHQVAKLAPCSILVADTRIYPEK